MLLSITTTHRPATDLGYLLGKHPDRCRSVDLAFGEAHVFYPVATDERCSASLVLELDPVALVRGSRRGDDGPLAQYVNDRPYVASSFLSVAISAAFGSALNGTCRERPELAATAIPLEAELAVVPCRGGEALLRRLFAPLGYQVEATRLPLDETFPAWGESPYALEAMSRFAVDPHWLIYLPPTMAPTETCAEGPWLEHPREAFAHYQRDRVTRVVCEEKHMGSRAVIVVCRDDEVARRRFGVGDGTAGIICSRTGRRFFASSGTADEVLARIRAAIDRSDLWARLATDWLCLDAEIMPWSAKAQELLRVQYAPTGAAGRAAFAAASAALSLASARCADARPLQARMEERRDAMDRYIAAYRRYCWSVASVADLRVAPFHVLASESGAHVDRDHEWHLATIAALCAADEELLLMTAHRWVDPGDEEQVRAGIAWWEALTERGGEGMVVKPADFVTRGRRGVVQPALKCRGREYLRIIYGPTYTSPDQLDRLRERGVGRKRSLALREFALGVEALHRFVEREPLYRVHECVFGVLALESEPVDPRL